MGTNYRYRPHHSFGTRLKNHMVALGWTQVQLAEKSGLSQPYISRLANDEQSPTADSTRILANAMNLVERDRALFFKAAATARGFAE